jgi:hypothetical protein
VKILLVNSERCPLIGRYRGHATLREYDEKFTLAGRRAVYKSSCHRCATFPRSGAKIVIELYHHGSSVCAAKVRFALGEKALAWTGRYVDILKGDVGRAPPTATQPRRREPQ